VTLIVPATGVSGTFTNSTATTTAISNASGAVSSSADTFQVA
jgi:hypothetical protein